MLTAVTGHETDVPPDPFELELDPLLALEAEADPASVMTGPAPNESA